MAKTLSSPGVEVHENDESLRITTQTGTTVFLAGFTSQGPVDEVHSVSSVSDFITMFGTPTNAAERYSFYTAKEIINSGNSANLLFSRLPYGDGNGDNTSNAYDVLVYPAIPIMTKNSINDELSGFDYFKISGDESLKNDKFKITINGGTRIPSTDFVLEETLTDVIDEDSFILNHLKLTNIQVVQEEGVVSECKVKVNNNSNYILCNAVSELIDENHFRVSIALPICTATNTEELIGVCNLIFTITYNNVSSTTKISIENISLQSDTEEEPEVEPTPTPIKFDRVTSYQLDSDVEGDEGKEPLDYSGNVRYSKDLLDKNITYLVGRPVSYHISNDQFLQLTSGEMFEWSKEPFSFDKISEEDLINGNDEKFGVFEAIKHAAFIVINKSRTIINDSYEGYYFGITDNLFNNTDDGRTYNAIQDIKISTYGDSDLGETTVCEPIGYEDENDFLTLNDNRLDFMCVSNNQGSLSKYIQNDIHSFDISGEEYDDVLSMAIIKLKKTTTSNKVLKLTYSPIESYSSSLGYSREKSDSTASTPVSFFIETETHSSNSLLIMVNPHINKFIQVDNNGNLHGKVRVYSDKLISNIRNYQNLYLGKTIYDTSLSKTTTSRFAPIKMAQNNVLSMRTLYQRLGLTPSLLRSMGLYYEEDYSNEEESQYKSFRHCNSVYPFGVYSDTKNDNKIIGSVPSKLNRALSLVSNDEEYPDLNLLVDGGLSTIYAYSNSKNILLETDNTSAEMVGDESESDKIFDETIILTGVEDLRTGKSSLTESAENIVEDYMAVQNEFLGLADLFTSGGRGDVYYVGDILRGALIKGKDTKVSKLFGSALVNNSYSEGDSQNVTHSFSTSIYYPIKHLTDSFTTTFASIYAQFFKILDEYTSQKVWIPASGWIAAAYCSADALGGPWLAPAGFNRGIINDVLDVAFSPNQNQRDDLYKICINTIPNFSSHGIAIWGIRTMSKKSSAFDQLTCRRTFLYIQQSIKKLLKYYVFEPNNAYTRLKITNDIVPLLDKIKTDGGIYSYTLVCDTTNNTEDIINEGSLAIDLSMAPTRTAENIILTMTANKYTGVETSTYS